MTATATARLGDGAMVGVRVAMVEREESYGLNHCDEYMDTADATRISYVYVRMMASSVETKLHTQPSTGSAW